jgi:hypothetical protein
MTKVKKRETRQIANAKGYRPHLSLMQPPAEMVLPSDSSSSAAGSRRWMKPVARMTPEPKYLRGGARAKRERERRDKVSFYSRPEHQHAEPWMRSAHSESSNLCVVTAHCLRENGKRRRDSLGELEDHAGNSTTKERDTLGGNREECSEEGSELFVVVLEGGRDATRWRQAIDQLLPPASALCRLQCLAHQDDEDGSNPQSQVSGRASSARIILNFDVGHGEGKSEGRLGGEGGVKSRLVGEVEGKGRETDEECGVGGRE